MVKYKFTKEDKALEIKIEDVIELFDNTSIYRKITYKNRDYLLKQLVKGPVSLYEQVITNTSSNGTLSNYSAYYLEKSIQLVKVGWTSYKEDLKSVLTDDPETIKKIDELKFGDLNAFIQALVNNYNNKTKGK